MVIGFFVLFIMPLVICLGCLMLYDYLKRIKKWKKNQNGRKYN